MKKENSKEKGNYLPTFTVVFFSYLKALVCPFSKYTLRTLGMNRSELPCEEEKVITAKDIHDKNKATSYNYL